MEITVVATNRKAFHEYIILDQFEAGLQLKGSEVKSIREGKASLKQAYILIRKGEAWLRGSHIASYSHTGFEGHEPVRDRKLLLHKKEIKRLIGLTSIKGNTLVAMKVYEKNGFIKVELALGKGRKDYDKRKKLTEKQHKKDMKNY